MLEEQSKIEVIKAVPAVAGTVTSIITLNEAVALVTLLYIALQMAYLIRKWIREERNQ